MPSFINYIKIDFYKFYHSKIIKVHFIIPVLAMIPFLSYYSVSPWNELDKVISYIQIISMSSCLNDRSSEKKYANLLREYGI